jgi:hypothetical protein
LKLTIKLLFFSIYAEKFLSTVWTEAFFPLAWIKPQLAGAIFISRAAEVVIENGAVKTPIIRLIDMSIDLNRMG